MRCDGDEGGTLLFKPDRLMGIGRAGGRAGQGREGGGVVSPGRDGRLT